MWCKEKDSQLGVNLTPAGVGKYALQKEYKFNTMGVKFNTRVFAVCRLSCFVG